ncbi:hypothetical protein CRG98_048875, partial [Punica granatum]
DQPSRPNPPTSAYLSFRSASLRPARIAPDQPTPFGRFFPSDRPTDPIRSDPFVRQLSYITETPPNFW